MVKETRKITFSAGELATAFESYGRRTPGFLPGGKMVSCTSVGDDGVGVKLIMEYGSSIHELEFIYRGLDILRTLILFCIENNIMLPRDGRKTFVIEQEKISLIIELDTDLDMGSTMVPMMGEHVRLIKGSKPPQRIGTTT